MLFQRAHAELEIRFDEARARLKATDSPLPSLRDRAAELIGSDVNGPQSAPGALDNGANRLLLARLERDRRPWNGMATGCSLASARFRKRGAVAPRQRRPVPQPSRPAVLLPSEADAAKLAVLADYGSVFG